LDRRPKRADRLPLVGRRSQPHSQIRDRIDRAGARSRHGFYERRRGARATGDQHCSDCVAVVADPVGAGYVESLARPGGNVTGFAAQEYAVSGKWIELLKELVPHLRRVAVLRDSALAAGPGQFGALQALAPSFGIELRPLDVHDPVGIEQGIATFAKGSNNGLIVTGSPSATLRRNLIISLAARHNLPAVYYERSYVPAGGLISYGSDYLDQCRRAASYVDRILKGEKPADLPVQAPVKYETAINLKTAKTLGLTVPDKLLALADEVIE
jgi:putative ABC transport system substrate-binding protein